MQLSSLLVSSFFRSSFEDNFKDIVGRLRYLIGRLLFHRCTLFMIFERFCNCKTFLRNLIALLFVASSHRSTSSSRLSCASKSSAADQPSREDQKYTG